jgi:hypothetical protein
LCSSPEFGLLGRVRLRIPSLLLAKLYLKGSLCNCDAGFALAMKNVLAPGTATSFLGLDVDGAECPLEQVSLLVDGVGRIEATEISSQAPLPLGLGCQVVVTLRGRKLAPGCHQIVARFRTKEVGEVRLLIRDSIQG